ncbi:MAG TPA: hypothetical protein ENI95_15825 [Chloroflexi bacterium]|nr:hypothetical protein [Chloroflexota bacterium]
MMYQNKDTEILFPARVIPALRDLRGEEWRQFVDRVLSGPPASLERQAFSLMMIRLGGCLTCHPDNYRAMKGCTLCGQQTIRRFKGSDAELIALFRQARADMVGWHVEGKVPPRERLPVATRRPAKSVKRGNSFRGTG